MFWDEFTDTNPSYQSLGSTDWENQRLAAIFFGYIEFWGVENSNIMAPTGYM